MRILYLHQYFNTPGMAGGTRSYEMARRLVAAGHEVNLVTAWREPTDRRGWFTTREVGINVHWLPVGYSNSMGFADRMRAFLQFAAASGRRAAKVPADVVFATSTPLTIALPGVYAARRQRVPFVFEVRDLWPDVPIAIGALRNPALKQLACRLERFAYAQSTRIVALAPGMRDSLVEKGVPRDRVAVIPNGCDLDVFAATDEPAVTLPRPGRAIVYVGTMGVANGVSFIPRLSAELGRILPEPVHFYLIGDGARRGEVEAVARELGVLDVTVHFIPPQPKAEVGKWIRAADATIMTYMGPEILYRDSVSNKFFDSLAAGRPVLANFRGFSTALAEEAGAGFIIGAEPAAAARRLADILADPGALPTAGAAAYALAVERFSRDDLAARLEVVLREAVAEGPRT